MTNIFTFLNEVKSELKKVTWPSRDEMIGSTIVVCIVVAIFAVILGGMDAVFSALIKHLIR